MVSVNEFPIATANEIPGFKIIETKGFVYGLTVRSRGVGGQVSAGLRSLVGGEIKEYVSMMEDSRDEALERLIEHAKQHKIHVMIAAIDHENFGSIHLHTQLGFKQTGYMPQVGQKFGQWRDLVLMQLNFE